jgi:hypothetical protein
MAMSHAARAAPLRHHLNLAHYRPRQVGMLPMQASQNTSAYTIATEVMGVMQYCTMDDDGIECGERR